MQEKIYDEWNKPDYTTIDNEELQRMEETIEAYYRAIEDIKDVLYGIALDNEEINIEKEIKDIIESLEKEI